MAGWKQHLGLHHCNSSDVKRAGQVDFLSCQGKAAGLGVSTFKYLLYIFQGHLSLRANLTSQVLLVANLIRKALADHSSERRSRT